MKARYFATLMSLIAVAALTACEPKKSPDTQSDEGTSPTSNDTDPAAAGPSPRETARLVRLVERGQGEACADQIVLSYILSQAVRSSGLGSSDWTRADKAEFLGAFSSDIRSIVLNAHDPVAKSVSCAAMYYEESSSATFWTELDYDVQVTVDGGVVVRIQNFYDLQATAREAVSHYQRTELQPAIDAHHRAEYEAQRVAQEAASRTAMLERANSRCKDPDGYERSPEMISDLRSDLARLSEPRNDYERATRACLERALVPRPSRPPNTVQYTGPPPNVVGPPTP